MKILPTLLLLTTGLPLVATAATPTSGTIHVTENDAGNNPTSVNLDFSTDTPDNVSFFLPGSNKGDYVLDFLAPLNDFASGVLLSSVAEHLRANLDRTSYATTSTHARSDGLYYIPVHPTPGLSTFLEFNADANFAFFTYQDWLAGLTNAPAGTAPVAYRNATPGIFGVSAQRPEIGKLTFDLRGFAARSDEGVLLANSYINNDSYALVETNADGTFTTHNRDNGTEGALQEDAAIAFAYISKFDVGTRGVAAIGHVHGDGSTPFAAGDFTVTPVAPGEWHLSVAGHDESTGTLVVQHARNNTRTGDNIVFSEWNGSAWHIISLDIVNSNGTSSLRAQSQGAVDHVFSFAFLEHAVPAATPTLTGPNLAASGLARQSSTSRMPLPARADATLAVDAGATTWMTATDPDATTSDPWWELEFEHGAQVTAVELINGIAGARHRLRDITIELLAADRSVLATSPLLNPENSLATFPAGPDSLRHDFSPTATPVRFVRVTRSLDNDLSGTGGFGDPNVLSLREVIVAGSLLGAEQPTIASFHAHRASPDPTTQGWQATDILAGATSTGGGVASAANAAISIDGSQTAWRVNDRLNNTSDHDNPIYSHFLSQADFDAAYALGWTLEARVKAVNDASIFTGFVGVEFPGSNDPGWGVLTGAAIPLQFGKTSATHSPPNAFYCRVPFASSRYLLSSGSGDEFHTITAVGKPRDSRYELFIDGVRRGEFDLTANNVTNLLAARTYFGAGRGADPAEIADFESVTFRTGPATTPGLATDVLFHLPFEPGFDGLQTYVERSAAPVSKPTLNPVGAPAQTSGAAGLAIDFSASATSLDASDAAGALSDLATATLSFSTASAGGDLFVFTDAASPNDDSLSIAYDGANLTLVTRRGGTTTANVSWAAPALAGAGWHHVALTFAAGQVTAYIDGFPAGTRTAGFTASVAGLDTFTIGGGTAKLDEIAIWGAQLTPEQIQTAFATAFRGANLAPDQDADSLNAFEESALNSDPFLADTDGDGVADGDEARLGIDPTRQDSDTDTLADKSELDSGTDPANPDTDGDQTPDNLDPAPLDPNIPLASSPDTDGDGLSDEEEARLLTDPTRPNTDGDDYDDFTEILLGSDPRDGNSTPLQPGPAPADVSFEGGAMTILPNGDVEIAFSTTATPDSLSIQSSPDLLAFSPLTTVPVDPGGDYLVTVTPPAGHRFFRAVAETSGTSAATTVAGFDLPAPAPGSLLSDSIVQATEGSTHTQTVTLSAPFTGVLNFTLTGIKPGGIPLAPVVANVAVDGANSVDISLDLFDDLSVSQLARYTLTLSASPGLLIGLDNSVTIVVADDDERWSGTLGISGEQMNFAIEHASNGTGSVQRLIASDKSGLFPQGHYPITADFNSPTFTATVGKIPLSRQQANLVDTAATVTAVQLVDGIRPQRGDGSTIDTSIVGSVSLTIRPPGGGEVDYAGSFSLSKQPPLMPSLELSEID